ncbi:hypothetical protein EE612_030989 [Oryza sativa]|uniref:TFIIB-type domain-containing protein n=2 Tax=Oryza TaxID=4527 RepID=A0A0E0HHR2_ORYNI|nr:hypothetical protein OsI_20862 [Oryza sativa Indica Group]KAB8100448.1 hypothetical protein EE612_030989 [Oryza sativa]
MHEAAANDGAYCPDCRRATAVVLDHTTGDTICTECALVLDARYIDETSEWRTFANDGASDDRDPNRVGDRADPFLPDHVGGTTIAYSAAPPKNASAADAAAPLLTRRRVDVVGPSPENALVAAFRGIADMADRLGLVATIRDRAKEVFKKLGEAPKGFPRGRNRDTVYAACLFIACRNEGMPRTYKELASVTAEGAAAKKEIGRLTTLIKKHLGDQGEGRAMDIGVVRSTDYLRRFCSRLGLGHQDVRAAGDAVRRLEERLDVRRNPESIAAAIIYMVVQRAGGSKSVRDVSTATGVAEGTITAAHKELAPHASVLFGG